MKQPHPFASLNLANPQKNPKTNPNVKIPIIIKIQKFLPYYAELEEELSQQYNPGEGGS